MLPPDCRIGHSKSDGASLIGMVGGPSPGQPDMASLPRPIHQYPNPIPVHHIKDETIRKGGP